MGKVVRIFGTKRAEKTTLSILLHKKYGYNYVSFAHLEDAIDMGINKNKICNYGTYFYDFFENKVNFSLYNAQNYDINTVLDIHAYSPRQIEKLKNSGFRFIKRRMGD